MTGLGLLEVLSFSLIGKKVEYELVGLKDNIKQAIIVEGTKSTEYEVLRESLIPSLLYTLSHNIHEVYPQKIFEIGKVFTLSGFTKEHWNIGAAIAHNLATYTEAKSVLQELLNKCFSAQKKTTISTPPTHNDMYIDGRCANVLKKKKKVGVIGEMLLMFRELQPEGPVVVELDMSYFVEKFRSRKGIRNPHLVRPLSSFFHNNFYIYEICFNRYTQKFVKSTPEESTQETHVELWLPVIRVGRAGTTVYIKA